jgi:hypothetical protein
MLEALLSRLLVQKQYFSYILFPLEIGEIRLEPYTKPGGEGLRKIIAAIPEEEEDIDLTVAARELVNGVGRF